MMHKNQEDHRGTGSSLEQMGSEANVVRPVDYVWTRL